MAIATDVYSLYELTLRDKPEPHYLLTRVRRRDYSNAAQADADNADLEANSAETAIIVTYARNGFGGPCTVRKIGEMQGRPVGEPSDDMRPSPIDVWVAQTEYGSPWIVLGLASNEEAFWEAILADPDLLSLKPARPARRLRAFFVPELES